MPRRSHPLLALLVALSLLTTACANTLEGAGGVTGGIGAGVFVMGAAFPSTRHCTGDHPCYQGGMPVQGDVTTYFARNVPVMITGAVVAATGITLYVMGRLSRPPKNAAPPPSPPPASPEDDPESTLLRQ